MNQPGHADSLDLLLGKAHLFGDGTGQMDYPPLMVTRVGISHLNGRYQGKNRSFQGCL